VQVYEATEWGLEAAPVIRALGRWAVRSPRHNPGLYVSAVSIMMSMQTMYSAEGAGDMAGRVQFRFGETSYVAEIRDGTFDARRGEAGDPDVTFTARPGEIAGILYGGAPLESVDVKGDTELAKRFITLFPLPPKVG